MKRTVRRWGVQGVSPVASGRQDGVGSEWRGRGEGGRGIGVAGSEVGNETLPVGVRRNECGSKM